MQSARSSPWSCSTRLVVERRLGQAMIARAWTLPSLLHGEAGCAACRARSPRALHRGPASPSVPVDPRMPEMVALPPSIEAETRAAGMSQAAQQVADEMLASSIAHGRTLIERARLIGDDSDFESWKADQKHWSRHVTGVCDGRCVLHRYRPDRAHECLSILSLW